MPLFRPQNVNDRRLMTAGQWHHWEIVMEANHPDRRDGKLSWWIDGELAMRYDDMVYRLPSAPRGFWRLKCNPTWGGTGETKTRDDRILVDHLYLSGVAARDAGAQR